MLSKAATKTLNRIGDLMIPGDDEFPSFSETQSVKNVHDITDYAPKDDIAQLNLLLIILSIAPGFILKWLIRKMNNSFQISGPTGPLFRQLNFGLRGIIYGLYYGDKTENKSVKNPLDIIDFEIKRLENNE